MIESAAYEIIKREGYEEGLKEGIQQLKFGIEGLNLDADIKKIEDLNLLEVVSEAIDTAENISEIRKLIS